ncbi:MAG: hypothetical protein WC848_02900 [Parcubacteria group bacterium]|jgi:hypothetical protein
MNSKQRTDLIDMVTAMQNQLTVLKRKLRSGKDVYFEATEKVFFEFVSEVHHARIQYLIDEMHKDSEDARKKLIEYLDGISKPAGVEEAKLETEKPVGTEETPLDFESIGDVIDNALGFVAGIFSEIKSQSEKARGKAGELAGEVSDAVKPTINDLSKKGGELWDALTSAGKDMVRKKAFTPEFTSRIHEELRKRGWGDEGIDTALAVFYQVLAEMDKPVEKKEK